MKKYVGITIILFFILIIFEKPVNAASFGISSSTGQVSPNQSFTVSIGGQCIGRVNISVSNGTASASSIWVEQNYVQVTITAGSSGNVVVTATPTPGFSDPDANEYTPGSRSTTVTIYESPSTITDSGKPPVTTNKPTTKPNKVDQKSSNNLLSSLTVENSELLPAFDANVSEYELNLPAGTNKINISANVADAKATLEGIGEIEVKERR